jgi:hypothetical protein
MEEDHEKSVRIARNTTQIHAESNNLLKFLLSVFS